MRVRFNNTIYLCTSVSHNKESKILIFTTSNGVYTADILTGEQADAIYDNLLIHGYCDISKYQYSN